MERVVVVWVCIDSRWEVSSFRQECFILTVENKSRSDHGECLSMIKNNMNSHVGIQIEFS